MKHFVAITLVLACAARGETLQEAVARGLQAHPAVRAADKKAEAADARIGTARGELLPSLDWKGEYGHSDERSTLYQDPAPGRAAEVNTNSSALRRTGTLTMTQLLYKYGMLEGIESARSTKAQKAMEARASREDLAARIIKTYLDVDKNREFIRLAEENVQKHQEILKTVQIRFQQKLANGADVSQVEGRLSLAQAQLEREKALTPAYEAAYQEAVCAPPPVDMSLPVLPPNIFPADLGLAFEGAKTSHPLLLADGHAIEAASHGLKNSDGRFLPQFSLQLSASASDRSRGDDTESSSASAFLVMDWNLIRGGAHYHDRISQLCEIDALDDTRRDHIEQIRRDLAGVWHQRRALTVEYGFYEKSVVSSQQTADAFTEQYRLGQRTLFDLLNAKAEVFQAKLRISESKHARIQAELDILYRMGTLVETIAPGAVKTVQP
jgi:adhesin transport system outer membrane protein